MYPRTQKTEWQKNALDNLRLHEVMNLFLFISDQVICLVYIDDTLFYSPTTKGMQDNEWIERVRNGT